MPIKNTGKEFESLTMRAFEIAARNEKYTSVEKDVLIESPDGERQFDVVIRSRVAGLDLLTVIECRDYNKNLSVTHIDGLHSKQNDVNANKAVLVARKGFSDGAIRKANRVGMTLCTVQNLERGLEDIGLQIPVVVADISKLSVYPTLHIKTKEKTSVAKDVWMTISDRHISEHINEILQENRSKIRINEKLICKPTNPEHFIRDVKGNKLKAILQKIEFNFGGSYYFGYIHELPSAIGMKNISKDETHIFFDSVDLLDFKKTFVKYKNFDEIPEVEGIQLIVMKSPKISADTIVASGARLSKRS